MQKKKQTEVAQAFAGSLVVTALAAVLRGVSGRNPVDNDDTTRHLSGLGFRVLAFGLALLP